jgi:phosphoglycerate dehydrogenase-like enzyme
MHPPTRILLALTDPEFQQFLPEPLASELRASGATVERVNPQGLGAGGLEARLQQWQPQVLVAAWSTPPLPEALPGSLRYVCYLCGSVKNLVRRAHLERGLQVTNWGSSISRTIAECALLHVLASLRRLPHWTFALHHEGEWQPRGQTPGESLFGQRVGLHGFGAIARQLVALLRPFGCRISVHAPDVNDAVAAEFGIERSASLEALFSDNDVIVCLAPLIPETTGIITESLLRRIRPGGVFVNVGRGQVVDEAALERVAREGRIQIGLDVYAQEPLPATSPLRGLRNVSLTPHVAGPTLDRRRDAGAFALRNIQAFLAGQPLQAVITADVYDRIT